MQMQIRFFWKFNYYHYWQSIQVLLQNPVILQTSF